MGWNGISTPQPRSQASVLLLFLITFFEEGSEPLLGEKVEFWSGNGTRNKESVLCQTNRHSLSRHLLRDKTGYGKRNSRLSHGLDYLSAKGSPRGHLTIPTLLPHGRYDPSFCCGEDLEGVSKSQGWSPL